MEDQTIINWQELGTSTMMYKSAEIAVLVVFWCLLTGKCAVQSQASLFWAVSRMGLRPSEALLDKASLVLQQKEIQAQVRSP